MAITNARILIRRGLEADFNPDGLQPGEWALSVDRGKEILRVCVSPGEFIRIATYESFEKDMTQIEAILEECKTIEEAVKQIQLEIDAKEIVIEQYVKNAKTYSETAANEAGRATLEADRAKAEADRAQGIVGGDYVTHAEIVEYSLIKDTGYELGLSIDNSTYVMTVQLKNANGDVLSEKTIDFPIESMVVNATYKDGTITLVLKNGETVTVEVSSLVSGLVNDTLTIAGIDLKDNITADELKQALGINPLDTYEEIMANTESGKFAGAKGVKEGFSALNDGLNQKINKTDLISQPLINISAKVDFNNSDAYFGYSVKNGMCTVSIWSMRILETCSLEQIVLGLPKPMGGRTVAQPVFNPAVGIIAMVWIGVGGALICNSPAANVGKSGYATIVYPVDE